MKRALLGCLIFISACQPATQTLEPDSPTGASTHTALAPGSPTPEPSLAPTQPPTPLPRFFTEEFDGGPPGWSLLQSNSDVPPQTRIQDGALILDLASPYNWVYVVIGNESYEDVRIDALTQSRGSTPEAIGLVCRYDEQAGWYEFNVSGDDTYNVLYGQWLAEGVARYTPIAIDNTEYLNPSGADNEIGLTCEGTNLWLYMNGKLFRKLNETRFGLTEGKVGLSVSSFENTAVIGSFDWVKVSQPQE